MSEYIPLQAEIVDIDRVTHDSYLISLQILDRDVSFTYRPGQFVMVSLFGMGECPISIASSPTRNVLQLCIRRAGRITNGIMDSMIGDVLGIRGPLGNGFPIDKMHKSIVIAGGGSGFATLRSLINYIVDRRDEFEEVFVAYGARTRQDLYFMQEYKSWKMEGIEIELTVDVGDESWRGNVGMVPELLDRMDISPPASAAICGPLPMIRAVANRLLENGFRGSDILLSMERHMKCGIGKCEHCTIGPYRVCKEGPVFPYNTIRDLL
ncbi:MULTISPECIES: FAD/NAD(P)-binding protein [Methanothrix]|uniref:Oxidoreductase FAD/NAD(P)-binding domain protein n=1 Tax=Methanothrix thermoacetophila (strain DSM 6194 / JCM 14653 / NBRC 101360 / PT) TaxID=349307 RepID=A0B6I4_METTP|nr:MULTISPECIES: FAD/NAD(P)-binding protein [Methanothrix]ABK14308.1 oxidoreductase FAD/NAD(P)-binding domain protein [Methanothrix thermoacetophila PT]